MVIFLRDDKQNKDVNHVMCSSTNLTTVSVTYRKMYNKQMNTEAQMKEI